MIRSAIASSVVLLAACGAPPSPPAADEPTAVPATSTASSALEGAFTATSTTAMGITGDLRVEENRLSFGKGFALETAPAGPVDITTPVRTDGDSFAATIVGPTSLAIELRRVTAVTRAADAQVQPLCGDAAPTFVALAHDTPPQTVSMAVFSGADAPGPQAKDTALCGTFVFNR